MSLLLISYFFSWSVLSSGSMTWPFLLQLNLTFGTPLALQVKVPVMPLSDADLDNAGDS